MERQVAFSSPPKVALVINVNAHSRHVSFKFASALLLKPLQTCWHPIQHIQGSSCRDNS